MRPIAVELRIGMRAARLNAVGFTIRGDFRKLAVAKLRLVGEGNGHAVLRAEQIVPLVERERLLGLAVHVVHTGQTAVAEKKGEPIFHARVAHDAAIADVGIEVTDGKELVIRKLFPELRLFDGKGGSIERIGKHRSGFLRK